MVCEKCGATVQEEQAYGQLGDLLQHLRPHCHSAGFGKIGCRVEMIPCGPLREETDQELFLRWAGNNG